MSDTIPYLNQPQFTECMKNFQAGNWELGLHQLSDLMDRYPLDMDLRSLRQEMTLRSRVDLQEAEDIEADKKRKRERIALSVLAGLVCLAVLIWVGSLVQKTLASQVNIAFQSAQEEVLSFDLDIKFRNAQNLYQAGRYEEAKTILEQVAVEDPEYEDVGYWLGLVNNKALLEEKYQEAVNLQNQGDIEGALALYAEISSADSNYKDVSLQIDELTKRSTLFKNLVDGDAAFEQGDWEDAITHYESLRALDPDFWASRAEDSLVESYMNAAEAILALPEKTLDDLEIADDYFRRALGIRPRDPEILARRAKVRDALEEGMFWGYIDAAHGVLSNSPNSLDAMREAKGYFDLAISLKPDNEQVRLERDLVDTYLGAKNNFDLENYEDAINGMEYVLTMDPGYAQGTARQILYEAYLALGDQESAGGFNDEAVLNYQRAAELAQEDPNSALRLYEAQVKLAGSYGILGNYQQAGELYRAAIVFSDFRNQIAEKAPELVTKLEQANQLYDVQSYRAAFMLYAEVTNQSTEIYEIQIHIVAQGEYLTLIASQYGSTVTAIAKMNNIQNINRIYEGQRLLIPVLVPADSNP